MDACFPCIDYGYNVTQCFKFLPPWFPNNTELLSGTVRQTLLSLSCCCQCVLLPQQERKPRYLYVISYSKCIHRSAVWLIIPFCISQFMIYTFDVWEFHLQSTVQCGSFPHYLFSITQVSLVPCTIRGFHIITCSLALMVVSPHGCFHGE